MGHSYSEVFIGQRGNCFYCGRPMKFSRGNGPTQYTLDHFYPKHKGNGINGNVVLTHPLCNLVKGGRQPTKSEEVRFRELYRKIKERKTELKNLIKEMV